MTGLFGASRLFAAGLVLAGVGLSSPAGSPVSPIPGHAAAWDAPPPIVAHEPSPQALLGGSWKRDDTLSDRIYWMGEYPEMTLEIAADEMNVRVRQSLGAVRDGVAQPGSGERFLEYLLVLDGEAREIPAAAGGRRTVTASWVGEAMRVTSRLRLGADGEL